jgi:hypothetical protein
MRLPNDKFSVAITGTGMIFSMFPVEFQNAFPNAKLFDRSARTNQIRAAEAALGKTKFAAPEFQKSSVVIEKNLTNPPKTDFTVNFEVRGPVEAATVICSSAKRMFNFDVEKAEDMQALVGYAKQVVDAIKLM